MITAAKATATSYGSPLAAGLTASNSPLSAVSGLALPKFEEGRIGSIPDNGNPQPFFTRKSRFLHSRSQFPSRLLLSRSNWPTLRCIFLNFGSCSIGLR